MFKFIAMSNSSSNHTLQSNETVQTALLDLKAIFFDMDGVLFNSMPLHARAWTEVFAQFDIHLTQQEPYENEGSTATQVAERVFNKYKNETISPEFAEEIKQMKHHQMRHYEQAQTMPHMPELLRTIDQSGIECWVVTGSGQASLLERLEMEFAPALSVKRMVTALDVKNGKPNPEPYLKALAKSGYAPHQVMVIENAPLGILSAKAAGLYTLAINTGPLDRQMLVDAGADWVLDDSRELALMWPHIFETLTSKSFK